MEVWPARAEKGERARLGLLIAGTEERRQHPSRLRRDVGAAGESGFRWGGRRSGGTPVRPPTAGAGGGPRGRPAEPCRCCSHGGWGEWRWIRNPGGESLWPLAETQRRGKKRLEIIVTVLPLLHRHTEDHLFTGSSVTVICYYYCLLSDWDEGYFWFVLLHLMQFFDVEAFCVKHPLKVQVCIVCRKRIDIGLFHMLWNVWSKE